MIKVKITCLTASIHMYIYIFISIHGSFIVERKSKLVLACVCNDGMPCNNLSEIHEIWRPIYFLAWISSLSVYKLEHFSKVFTFSVINMFSAIYITEHSESCLSLSRDCSTQRCQRNWNEIYRTCTFHVWHCRHIWFHCWSWLHWMVSLILFSSLSAVYISRVL